MMMNDLDGEKSVFTNEYQQLLVNVVTTAGWLNEQLKRQLSQEKITPQQYHILKILQRHGRPLSTMQLRQRMPDKMSDTSRIVERMLLKKLVSKKMNKSDRRLVEISLTPTGETVLQRLESGTDLMQQVASPHLSTAEAGTLNGLLAKLRGQAALA